MGVSAQYATNRDNLLMLLIARCISYASQDELTNLNVPRNCLVISSLSLFLGLSEDVGVV